MIIINSTTAKKNTKGYLTFVMPSWFYLEEGEYYTHKNPESWHVNKGHPVVIKGEKSIWLWAMYKLEEAYKVLIKEHDWKVHHFINTLPSCVIPLDDDI